MDNIILIGMPGSGKSTVGVVLAKALGRGFLDVDLLIQEQEGALLQELIDTRGVERFLDLERDVICSLGRRAACRGTVVAPGGSCVCREESIAHMRAMWSTSSCLWGMWSGASKTWLPGVSPSPPARRWPTYTGAVRRCMKNAPTSPSPSGARA